MTISCICINYIFNDNLFLSLPLSKCDIFVVDLFFIHSAGGRGRISTLWSSDNESVLEAQLETSFLDTLHKDSNMLAVINQTQVHVEHSSMC